MNYNKCLTMITIHTPFLLPQKLPLSPINLPTPHLPCEGEVASYDLNPNSRLFNPASASRQLCSSPTRLQRLFYLQKSPKADVWLPHSLMSRICQPSFLQQRNLDSVYLHPLFLICPECCFTHPPFLGDKHAPPLAS